MKKESKIKRLLNFNLNLKLGLIWSIFACSIFQFSGCTSKGENTELVKSIEQKKSKIEITAEQIKTVGIEIGNIEKRNLHNVIQATGYLEVFPQDQAFISTYIGAIVKTINIVQGNYVTKGQQLASLEHPDFIKLQEEYLSEMNNLNYFESEYLRQKELNEKNAGTKKIFQKAENEYNTAKIRISSLENQLRILSVNLPNLAKGNITPFIIIKAPISGYVKSVKINVGEYAEPNKILFEIIDNSKAHCDLLVYEKDLLKIKVGQKVSFVLANQQNDNTNYGVNTFEGKISIINKSFEENTKAVKVHTTINNPTGGLLPGMYLNALIEISDAMRTAVPTQAIVNADGKDWIFLVRNFRDGKYDFKMIEIVRGISELGYTEVSLLEKVPENSKIAVKNSFFILSKVKEGESGDE